MWRGKREKGKGNLSLYLPVCCKDDPPQPPLKRGENPLKVPLFKGDLGLKHCIAYLELF
jgi:hypothetical protein